MSSPAERLPDLRESATARRGWRTWWRRQSPAQQDDLAALAPLLSVFLFLAAMILAFWYLRTEDVERERESVQRDTEVAQQQIRLRLLENQEQLARSVRELGPQPPPAAELDRRARHLAIERPEIASLSWLDAGGRRRSSHGPGEAPGAEGEDPLTAGPEWRRAAAEAFAQALRSRQPVYSQPYAVAGGDWGMQLHLPLYERGVFRGALVAEYSLERLMRSVFPAAPIERHRLRLADASGATLASTLHLMPGQKGRSTSIVHAVPLTPGGHGIVLVGEGYRNSLGLISNSLFWMVAALSLLTLWMLVGTWRHMRRRLQMQKKLASEANFRRAMENSMLTGMRAMDMQGRITYVNPAFCEMTGFSESELLYRRPPFPHWPPDRYEENSRLLQQELRGQSPAGGIEVKVMRKDGTLFDARMYVSPLIDPKNQQAGWMTSMTNITEAKRIRDQLTASHERFTTVLEGLDAAVSVLSMQQGELLFANRSYRLWFGISPQAHAELAGAEEHFDEPPLTEPGDSLIGLPPDGPAVAGSPGSHEVFVETAQKWFEVRTRLIQWTDGRLAQMLIATDITARRHAEALAASQADKAQVTSRLVTMGEMASSVAHELNQPLTAIANYCNGIVSRVNNDAIDKADLLAALHKTSRQAQRAGEIIRRIREFVKRSEPQRQRARARTIIEDAVELAGIELRRRNVAIHTYVAQRLPPLLVDPILIEQVLLNLLKNAAEAIDMARMPPARRRIELRVVPKHSEDDGGEVIEFSITDLGPGLPEEVIARLYEAFFSTKAEGLGIGLSLCRTIIESHRGRIRAQNLYNGSTVSGCCFSFTLPVDTSTTEAPAAVLP